MSYDMQVYGAREVSPKEFAEILAAGSLSAEGDLAGGSVEVSRGARHRYSFTVDGPQRLETEDVPDAVVAAMTDASVLYTLSVEGTLSAEIPHAVRFGKRLARAARGVLDDPRVGLWSDGKLRTAPRPRRSAAVDVLHLKWYTPPADPAVTARAWIDCARRSLPEALPRRFGFFEPLQHTLAAEGEETFLRLAANAEHMTVLRGTMPCIEGMIGGRSTGSIGSSHYLLLFSEALRESGWRDAVQRFFTDFASATSARVAVAEILTAFQWNERSLSYGFDTQTSAHLSPLASWMGLPPYPVSWAWFDDEYLDLIGEAIAQEVVRHRPHGALVEFVREPAARDDLPPSPVPADLRARLAKPPQTGASISLLPASRMPSWAPLR